jgi:hypothetical protein
VEFNVCVASLNVTKSGDRFVKLKSFVMPMDLWVGLCAR